MANQRGLDLHGAEAMAADVHHVIDAAEYPVVTVGVAASGVASKIRTRNAAPVLLLITVGIAQDVADHAGPRPPQDQESFLICTDLEVLEIDNVGDDTG